MTETVTLNFFADLIKVHPRTVLRVYTGEQNPNWDEDYDPLLDLSALLSVYELDRKRYDLLVKGRDQLVKKEQLKAAHCIKTDNTFYKRKYPKAIDKGKTVRYSLRVCGEHAASLKALKGLI